jgi:Ca2+-binding EF-hand superfamily protein
VKRLLVGLLLLALAGCADQRQDHVAPPPAFELADADRDQVVVEAEWQASGQELFERLDRDGDGTLDAAELAEGFEVLDLDGDGAIEPEEGAGVIELGDRDGDGALSRDEYGQIDGQRINLDVNRDGQISATEFFDGRRRVFVETDRDRDGRLQAHEIDPVRFTIIRF